jgi:hypothetical protein
VLGNFAGGLLAEAFSISQRTLSLALHAAAGIVLAVLGVELMPQALKADPPWLVVLAFVAGGGFFILLDHFIDLIRSRLGNAEPSAAPFAIFAGTAVDLFSDGIMIGTGSNISLGLGLLLALGQVPADVPEGFATIVAFKARRSAIGLCVVRLKSSSWRCALSRLAFSSPWWLKRLFPPLTRRKKRALRRSSLWTVLRCLRCCPAISIEHSAHLFIFRAVPYLGIGNFPRQWILIALGVDRKISCQPYPAIPVCVMSSCSASASTLSTAGVSVVLISSLIPPGSTRLFVFLFISPPTISDLPE